MTRRRRAAASKATDEENNNTSEARRRSNRRAPTQKNWQFNYEFFSPVEQELSLSANYSSSGLFSTITFGPEENAASALQRPLSMPSSSSSPAAPLQSSSSSSSEQQAIGSIPKLLTLVEEKKVIGGTFMTLHFGDTLQPTASSSLQATEIQPPLQTPPSSSSSTAPPPASPSLQPSSSSPSSSLQQHYKPTTPLTKDERIPPVHSYLHQLQQQELALSLEPMTSTPSHDIQRKVGGALALPCDEAWITNAFADAGYQPPPPSSSSSSSPSPSPSPSSTTSTASAPASQEKNKKMRLQFILN